MKSTLFFGIGIVAGAAALAEPIPRLWAAKPQIRPAAAAAVQPSYFQALQYGEQAGPSFGTCYVPEDLEAHAWLALSRGAPPY